VPWADAQRVECTFTVNTSYNSIYKTVYSLQDKFSHPLVSEVQLSFPLKPKQITDLFRNHVKALTKHKGKKCVAVIDSIVSNPGVLMPWKELVKICKEEGIWSVIDAAHSIGQEQNIDLTEAAPDFWTSVRFHFVFYFKILVFRPDDLHVLL